MTLVASLVDSGSLHAVTTGTVSAGAASGQVAAPGANVLMKLTLPFDPGKVVNQGSRDTTTNRLFEDQFYVIFVAKDANITDARLDAQEFEYSDAGVATLRLRLDVDALPATVTLWLEAHHSWGR